MRGGSGPLTTDPCSVCGAWPCPGHPDPKPRQQRKLTWRREGNDEVSYEGRFVVSPYQDDDRYRYEVYDRMSQTSIDMMFTLDQAKQHAQTLIDREHNQ